ncbi:NAD(P)/FAD-dependent oxidoreductase [Actinomadura roseirufa]|uniref:NAD(P)/FAD-dependent oxidoreductase n=1 Tax=Actinomadura roseirufa TaxID=2094049 RepID=UPI001041B10F|nr:tryptophan 7-halogenase [Actinomadura roseirufa]
MLDKATNCDVLIIGSGMAGSMLGAILARGGAKVVLVDGVTHPRFAVGESTIPHFLVRLQMLAARYKVPEITTLESIDRVDKEIGTTFGIKRHFAFVSHREGEEPDPRETILAGVPKALYKATHIFRQDSDSYMFHVAIKYGCVPRQNWRVADIDLRDDGVTVTGQNGEVIEARYVVDGSGFRSPIADKLDLRDDPCRFKTSTRSLFTHMVDVPPFDHMVDWPKEQRPPLRWHDGTLHHTFDRGFFWIIPFDNRKKSTNPLCSVGLVLDTRVHPKPADMTPEEEFFSFVDKFPAVKRHFRGARRVREWVSTGRVQYSSKKTVGRRWCLMSHAAGFIDPLFSRGMSNTVEVIDAVAWRILESLKDDDFSEERYEYVERLQQGLLSYNDDLCNTSLLAFPHFKLWDAIFRVWGFSSNYGAMRLSRAQLHYNLNGDDQVYRDLEKAPNTGFWWPDEPETKAMWDAMVETVEKFEVGEVSADDAAERILRMVLDSDLPPAAFGYKDPSNHNLHPTTMDLARFMTWAIKDGPPAARELAAGTVEAMGRAALRRKKIG